MQTALARPPTRWPGQASVDPFFLIDPAGGHGQRWLTRPVCVVELLMSMVEQPERRSLRSFTVDDEHLAGALPGLSPDEFALDEVTDEEWDAFHTAIADA